MVQIVNEVKLVQEKVVGEIILVKDKVVVQVKEVNVVSVEVKENYVEEIKVV